MANRSYLTVIVLARSSPLVLSMAAFTVRETELAIKFRFGEIVRADYEPGLHFMVPLVNNVRKFDKRILTAGLPGRAVPDQRRQDPAHRLLREVAHHDVSRYYPSTAGGDEEVRDPPPRRTSSRTASRASSPSAPSSRWSRPSARSSWANVRKVAERQRRGARHRRSSTCASRRIDLPEEVSESVFNRMRQDFARQAAQLRAEGSAVSERMRAEADRQRTEILADAYREAEIIRGEGDAPAAEIYAEAYGRDRGVLLLLPQPAGLPSTRSASRATCW